MYVDGLIGPDTVNTAPPDTVTAFEDHGTVAVTLTLDVDQAREQLAAARSEAKKLTEESNKMLAKAKEVIAAARDEAETTTAEAEARVQMLTRTADNYSARVRSEADQAAKRVRTIADDDAAHQDPARSKELFSEPHYGARRVRLDAALLQRAKRCRLIQRTPMGAPNWRRSTSLPMPACRSSS